MFHDAEIKLFHKCMYWIKEASLLIYIGQVKRTVFTEQNFHFKCTVYGSPYF